jgi:hypothetical protein
MKDNYNNILSLKKNTLLKRTDPKIFEKHLCARYFNNMYTMYKRRRSFGIEGGGVQRLSGVHLLRGKGGVSEIFSKL